jgi:S1-C subfamily serine protease
VAEKAGLQRGDIIQSIAGKRVRNMAAMDQLINTLKAGESVTVRFLRNGEDHNSEFNF